LILLNVIKWHKVNISSTIKTINKESIEMSKNNMDVRRALVNTNLRQWMVAERYGLSEGNFSRLLRKELATEKKEEILNVIEDLQKELQGGEK
jgi:predicted XRE-type DNA-binding protein